MTYDAASNGPALFENDDTNDDKTENDALEQQLEMWLFSGALCHPSGAVAAWRNAATGELSYPYPEITGYFLTLAADLGRSGLPAVRRAARWLVHRHARPERESRPTEPGVVYVFDRFIQATGLLNHGLAASDAAAHETGARLLRTEAERILAERDIRPLAPGSTVPARPATWSTAGRLHLLKAVQGLCLAHEVTGCPAAIEAAALLVGRHAERVAVAAPDFADAAGRRYLHPFCYALEGLWMWSAATGSTGAGRLAAEAFRGLAGHRLADGGYPQTVGGPGAHYDVTAQVARLGALLARDAAGTDAVRARLRGAARPAGGGGRYVPYRAGSPDHQSSWASMFALQALRAAHRTAAWQRLV
ncbi:hypothetical protein [Streptomyces sp. MP131-18]|uniref:hypothetical protein n=1 Tax=Streptomyces sp. MP131-18 TaxID=1857892 RepID=UPI00097C8289|nr:hypothetical protein [Streptomyces sp. MP131-18]ONK15808.1 hypothetical protein STBA_66490 [Streptomyces sp. MP131-18]